MGCDGRSEAVREHARRGELAISEGKYQEAFVAFRHGRELDPQDASLQRGVMRARAYAIAEQPDRVAADVLDDARYEAQLLADTDKAHLSVYLTALGNLAARSGDFEGARGKLEDAVKADPKEPLAHTALGLVLGTRKEYGPRAKAEIDAALAIKPDHLPALLAKGQIELLDGDLPGASSHLEAALKVREDVTARLLLGEVRLRQQRPAEAAEQFQRAASIDPKNADAMGRLGQVLLSLGRAEEAERALRAAAQLRNDTPTLNALGFALMRQKKSAEALGLFGQTLEREGSSAEALYGAALASEELGRADQAIGLYRKLLAIPGQGDSALAGMKKDAEARATNLAAAQSASAAVPARKP